MLSLPIRMVILGAGDRGRTYASYAAAYPERVRVVGVADINPVAREAVARAHGVPASAQWGDWSEAVAARPDCDVMVISMPDALHVEPAIACLDAGYHLLLEKPMARTWGECERLAAKVREKRDRLVILGHVLRYTVYFKKLHDLLQGGAIGEVVSIQHLEPVAYMHAAHSFCRGNWGNTERATPMILQKCCHDFDQFVWWLGKRCVGVSSFGNTFHFNKAHRPAGAADRCLACPTEVERRCPYSAKKIYLERQDYRYPFVDKRDEAMEAMLREGPYGRCVYACDNDAVDHQVVNLLFEGGVTVAHQMESYTYTGGRETKVFGTRGEIVGNGRTLTIYHFDTRQVEVWDSVLEAGMPMGSGHGGGDYGLMDELVRQLTEGDAGRYLDIFEVSLESHRIAFAAEESRRQRGALMLAKNEQEEKAHE